MFQAENDPKPSQGTAPDSFTDCENIPPTQFLSTLYEKKVNVDDDVTDCEFAEININKPPQSELFPNEMTKQVIILDDYKKDKKPFEVMSADNVVSEDLLTQRKEVEKVVPNNIKHAKNTFEEVVRSFTMALQSQIRVQSEDIPIHDIIKISQYPIHDIDKDQREKSNVSLVVASNVDDKVVVSSVDGNVKNEQDENENTYCRIDLPSQENMDVLSGNVTLTNVNDSSDEESTPKKSKRFTFTDSDLPDSDEIRDIIQMYYQKPTVEELSSESESEKSSEDESYESLRRRRNIIEPATKIDLTRMIGIEMLPGRIMTRLRKPTYKLLSGGEVSKNILSILKPSYLTEQEDQMDEDNILENIKRLKSFQKAKTYKPSKNHKIIKEVKKETTPRKRTHNKSNEHKRKVKVKIERIGRTSKTKKRTRKNTKDSLELNSISAAKTTIRRTRSMRMENDGRIIHNKTKTYARKNTKEDSLEKNSITAAKTRRTRSMRMENDYKLIHNKTKTYARNNTKEDSLEQNSITASKTRRTRSMRMENDGKIIHNKTKKYARKNTKEDSLEQNSISPAKTTTGRNRSMRMENDGKNNQNKCHEMLISGKKNKKPDHKRKPKKERIMFPEIEDRRSKTLQKLKEKNDDTMKAPLSILIKSIPKQSTLHNVSSSSSESLKSLKTSLVYVSDVPRPKRATSHNINNNNSINNASLRATPARAGKTQCVHISAFPGKEHKQDKIEAYVLLARCEPAQKRFRTLNNDRKFLCKRTAKTEVRRKSARTSTKRLYP